MSQSLEFTQQEFFTALLEPLRGSSREATDFLPSYDRHSDRFLQIAEHLVRPRPNLTPAEGLELYHRQYWFRLIDSLAEDFSGLRRLLGESRFWELVEQYLKGHPSRSFTLRHLGQALPEMVSKVDGEFAGAVAQIEWSMMLAFEAAQLPIPDEDSLTRRKVQLQPHVQVLDLPAAAGRWLDNNDLVQRVPEDDTSMVVVWRTRRGAVAHRTEDRRAMPLLAALQRGGLLEELLLEADVDVPDSNRVFEWFRHWQQLGWLGLSISPISS